MKHDANNEAVARAFVEARRGNIVVSEYPGTMPGSLADAYAIQEDGIRLFGREIGGWKVGRISPLLVQAVGADRIIGPIFADSIFHGDNKATIDMPVLHGFAAAEAELILRVGATVPSQTDISSIPDFIDEVRFGIEIASSPFPNINDHGPAVTVSDFGNNFGLVLGPQIIDWRQRDLMSAPVDLAVDGMVVGTGKLVDMLDGPFGAAAFLANLLSSRGIALTPGMWISTGAITGVHNVEHGQTVHATFDNEFEISCDTSLYSPAILKIVGDQL